jgi:hypothetical protein
VAVRALGPCVMSLSSTGVLFGIAFIWPRFNSKLAFFFANNKLNSLKIKETKSLAFRSWLPQRTRRRRELGDTAARRPSLQATEASSLETLVGAAAAALSSGSLEVTVVTFSLQKLLVGHRCLSRSAVLISRLKNG